MEDPERTRDEEQDVETHRRSRRKLMASEEPREDAQGGDDDVEVHGRRKHRA